MNLFCNSSYYSVKCSRADIDAFRAKWPCCGLPDGPITFEFDRRNDDLVDIRGTDYDGPDLVALMEDAKAYGKIIIEVTNKTMNEINKLNLNF